MHQKAINKMDGIILGSLERCEVLDNWPQYESFEKHIDSLAKELLKHKAEWINNVDVFSVYYDLVASAIYKARPGEEKYSGNLGKLLGEEGLSNLAAELSQYYQSIPRIYDIYFPIPKITKNIDGNVQVSDTISLIAFTKGDEVPGGCGTGLLRLTNKFDLNKIYLKVTIEGYSGKDLENNLNRKAYSVLKIFLQQGLFKGLLKKIDAQQSSAYMGNLLSGFSHYSIPKSNLLSVDSNRDPEEVKSIELPIEVCKLLDSIDFNWNNKRLLESYENGDFPEAVLGFLKQPGLLVESKEPEAKRIRSAIEWCFDALVNENEKMAFLQICIALEAILGDTESNGSLTDTLADRCGYLVANNIKGRKKIKNEFKDLYKARSKLVHGVSLDLKQDQRRFARWGNVILEFAIMKEIGHLELK